MIRSRRWSVLLLLVIPAFLLLSSLRGQAPPEKPPAAGEKPPEKWLFDRTVTLTPAPAPVPALKYRLFPLVSERKPGNAVPMYLRFAHERSDARKKELRDKPEQWNKLPLDKLPLDEVKKFLASYQYNFKQLELGARRKTADWNYSLDAGDVIGILLPDLQEMRSALRRSSSSRPGWRSRRVATPTPSAPWRPASPSVSSSTRGRSSSARWSPSPAPASSPIAYST